MRLILQVEEPLQPVQVRHVYAALRSYVAPNSTATATVGSKTAPESYLAVIANAKHAYTCCSVATSASTSIADLP